MVTYRLFNLDEFLSSTFVSGLFPLQMQSTTSNRRVQRLLSHLVPSAVRAWRLVFPWAAFLVQLILFVTVQNGLSPLDVKTPSAPVQSHTTSGATAASVQPAPTAAKGDEQIEKFEFTTNQNGVLTLEQRRFYEKNGFLVQPSPLPPVPPSPYSFLFVRLGSALCCSRLWQVIKRLYPVGSVCWWWLGGALRSTSSGRSLAGE
jgi:hypothetical protein